MKPAFVGAWQAHRNSCQETNVLYGGLGSELCERLAYYR